METNKFVHLNKESGFALLMSLVVVGVLISIGLSVLELSIKQVQLSTNARDSEIAFHAANAGMECSRYIRRDSANEMETGAAISPTCFGVSPVSNTNSEITTDANVTVTGNGQVFRYDYDFTWGTDSDRCTQITTIVASSSLPGSGLNIDGVPYLVPGYSNGNDLDCDAGEKCTVLAVRGYNKPCTAVSNFGTVQREVLLEF